MDGTPDSLSSGIGAGGGAPPPSGGAGGSLSAEMASAGRRLRMAMATKNPEASLDPLLEENTRGTLPYSCFDHDIFTHRL